MKDKANEDMCEEVLAVAEGEVVIPRIRMLVVGMERTQVGEV